MFDTSKLDWLNGRYMREDLSTAQFLDEVRKWALNDEYLTPIAEMAQSRIVRLSDLGALTAPFFMNRIDGMSVLTEIARRGKDRGRPAARRLYPCAATV